MAVQPQSLFSAGSPYKRQLRASPFEGGINPKKLAAVSGAPELALLTPLAFNRDTGLWQVWQAAPNATNNEIQKLDTAGATGGTFTLTFEGQTTAGQAFNVAAATLQTALEGLSSIGSGNVAVSLASGVYTITFQGTLAAKDVPQLILVNSMTGGSSASAAVTTTEQGSADNGVNDIAGFVWPDVHASHATNETIVSVLTRGQVHRDDVPVPSGETQADLDQALREGPRSLGLDILGLEGVH